MHPEGSRPARAWDDIVAPPSPAPVVTGSAAPLTAAPPPPPAPSVTGPGGQAVSFRGPPPPAPAVAAAPLAAPPPPGAPPTLPGVERGNGHLRAAPMPTVVPDEVAPEPERAPRRREQPARPKVDRRWPGRRRRSRRLRARKVRRQIRHIDTWSVLKFSVLFFLVMFLVVLTATVLLWNAAASTGLVDNIESFVEELFGFEAFQFEPGQMLRASALIGLVMVVAGTATTVLMAILFNLISDLVGGIRVTVIEEETRRPVV